MNGATTGSKSSTQTALYDESLQGYWLLDESSGNALDSSGNGYDMIVTGATQGAAGHINTAYDFDGVNDDASVNAAALNSTFSGTSVITIAFWASSAAYNALDAAFAIGNDNTDDVLAIYPYFAGGMGAEQINVWYDGEFIFAVANTLLADGTLNHFCYVQRSATDHELYINGVSVATDATSKAISAAMDNVTIGAYDPTNNEPFDGIIDQVRLYNVALTDPQIASLAAMVAR